MTPSPETAARRPSVTGWWLAAIAAVVAVAVAIVLLAGARPAPDVLKAVQAHSTVPAQAGPTPAAHAPSAVQVATARKVKATETAAQSAAASADATAQTIAAAEPAPR